MSDFNDGDAMAQAMQEVYAKREAELQKPFKITVGLRGEIAAALRAARDFADRYTGDKKPAFERKPSREVVARIDSALTKLEKIETATAVRERAGRRAQSSATPKARARD